MSYLPLGILREKLVDRNASGLLSALINSSMRLLRRNPALWLTGFLAGVLAALLLSRYAPAWDAAEGLQAVLALRLVALAVPVGWVLRECARQRLTLRRGRIPVRRDSTEE